jgi:hypothetical protein
LNGFWPTSFLLPIFASNATNAVTASTIQVEISNSNVDYNLLFVPSIVTTNAQKVRSSYNLAMNTENCKFTVSGSQVITGSLVGQPISQSVSSLTASLNLATGNFFNLTLPASVNTYITASGQVAGQTINLKITQGATTGSVTLGAGFKQVSGSAYTVTAAASAVDIVTFISFDNTGLYVSNVKNLI